jgi:hypothetical protein
MYFIKAKLYEGAGNGAPKPNVLVSGSPVANLKCKRQNFARRDGTVSADMNLTASQQSLPEYYITWPARQLKLSYSPP